MDPNNEKNKSWKKTGTFGTYVEAAQRKQELLAEDDKYLIKIRRCGPEGSRFRVKFWHPDFIKPKSNKDKKRNKSPDSSVG